MTRTAKQIVSDVDIKAHAARLTDILVGGYADALSLAYQVANEDYKLDVSFSLTNPKVQETIKTLGKRVKDISDTTRTRLQDVVEEALKGTVDPDTGKLNTPSIPEIAKRVREAGITDSRNRSETIARSETATSYNLGALLSYSDAGVDKVEVLDSDADEECASANGQLWTLDEAQADPIAHPNCTRAFSPVVE